MIAKGIPDSIRLRRTWRLGDQIGAGGFAQVFLAYADDGQTAVVKLIPKVPGSRRELLFENLDGVANVMPILESGETDDYWALVMPQATKSLRNYLIELGEPLTVSSTVSVLVDVAETLAEIEDRVVHRDIKPDNILLMDDRWHLADFGIARYAEATTAPDTLKYSMTRAYAAPEQWRGERATSATDVYALGVVAYELLTGRRPFEGPDYRRQHLEEQVAPITGIPERVRSLVNECLFKAPEARPRPQNLLARLKGSMKTASPARAQLQQANAVAVERQAEEARQKSIAQVEAERRRNLADAADHSLDNIGALLNQSIVDNASGIQLLSQGKTRIWSLNDAKIQVSAPASATQGTDKHLPFDVIAYTDISVVNPADRYGYTGRSHSLWYCDAHEAGVFRWYETAFMQIFGRPRKRDVAPFSMSPNVEDVALALSPAMQKYKVAWPFIPIDQGDEESFIERWIGWFALAAQDQLSYPSNMPERDTQGSWRRG